MESHDRYRLFFIVLSIVLFLYLTPHTHAYRDTIDVTLSPDMAPNLQPLSSPGPSSVPIANSPNLQPASSPGPSSVPIANSPNLQPASSPAPASVPIANSPNLQPASSPGPASVPIANSPNLQLASSPGPASVPIANSPNLQPASSAGPASVPIANSPNLQHVSSPSPASILTANSPLNYISFPPSGSNAPSNSILSSELEAPTPDGSTSFISKNVDPKVLKICDSTDHPSLCLGTVVPLLDDKTDSFSVLEVSVKACSELTKLALSMAKKFSNMPGVPPQVASVIQDCKDSYDEAMYNFEKAMIALPERDIGTLNTVLSAVITDIGDCEDELSSTGSTSPLSNYAEKLTNMTSNCLAIASLLLD